MPASSSGSPEAWPLRKRLTRNDTHPFEPGMAVDSVLSTFPAINTSVDGLQICKGMENIASVMDRATLIRSAVQPDLGSILHSRHQYHWHTGYVPPQTVACPHIGSWMARVLGPKNPVMPPFINIGQRLEGVGEKEELKAFTTAGFFGSEYGPMNLPFPEEASKSVQPPEGMTAGAFRKPGQTLPQTRRSESPSRLCERLPAGPRCCARWTMPTGSSAPRNAAAFDLERRTSESAPNTTPRASVAAVSSRGVSLRMEPVLSKSRLSMCPSSISTPTRKVTAL